MAFLTDRFKVKVSAENFLLLLVSARTSYLSMNTSISNDGCAELVSNYHNLNIAEEFLHRQFYVKLPVWGKWNSWRLEAHTILNLAMTPHLTICSTVELLG